MSLKLTNTSRFQTADLRKVLLACIARYDGHDAWKVTVENQQRGGRKLGYAYYNSRTFILKIPKDVPFNLLQFVDIALHEIDHCYNERHREMNGGRFYREATHDHSIAQEIIAKLGEGFTVREIQAKPKPVVIKDRAAIALERAKVRLAKAEREKSSAEKRSAKWKKEVARLERYIASRGPLAPPKPKEKKAAYPNVVNFRVDFCTYDLIFNERDLDSYYGDDQVGREQYARVQKFMETNVTTSVDLKGSVRTIKARITNKEEQELLGWVLDEFKAYPNGIKDKTADRLLGFLGNWAGANVHLWNPELKQAAISS